MDRTHRTVKLVGIIWIISACVIGAGYLPGPPNNPNPASGSTNVSILKVLTWRSDGATLGYDVYFGTTTSPKKVASVMLPTYLPVGMLPTTTYYWRVVGKNASGTTAGPLWSFKTGTSSGTPVDCVLSAWKLTSVTAWSTCQNGQQTRTETWTRTVITPPSNGGKACGPLTETRTGTRSCTPPPPSPGGVLLNQSNLIYEGAFRVPVGASTASFEYGGTALTYNPARNSLMLVGHDWYQRVGEISIPTPSQATTVAGLPRAQLLQSPTDVLQGKIKTIDGDTANGVKVGGLVVLPNSLVASVWSFYDAGPQKQTKSHFVTGKNFAALSAVTGPFQVGNGYQSVVPTDTTRIGGFVSGYMSTIPGPWQSVLGGTHLTGQGGGVSILARTSSGPSATAYTPAELGVPGAPAATLLMGYPSDSSNPSSKLHRPTLGLWGVSGGQYNGTQFFRGMVFPEGTRTILFFGKGGTRFCYGPGTPDKSLDLQQVPGYPAGVHWCYDPVDSSKGTHGYPNRGLVFAYDANDFLLVKAGLKQSWEVVPYATWTFSLPFQKRLVNNVDLGDYSIVGAAYDAAGKRIFLSAYRQDGQAPLIHVFRLP